MHVVNLNSDEEKLNNMALDKAKATKKNNVLGGILGTILTLITGIVGIYLKNKATKKE